MSQSEIQAAVNAAFQAQQPAIDQAIRNALRDALPDVVKGAVTGTQEASKKPDDPYRTTVHFLTGLATFCLAVIVGVFNAFPEPPIDPASVPVKTLGGVLAWISAAALAATLSALIAQLLKRAHREQPEQWKPKAWWHALLMGVPAAFGAVAVAYSLRGGAALLTGAPELLGLGEALCKLAGL